MTAATHTYMSGSLVRTIATFTDITGAPANPTTVTLKVQVGVGATPSEPTPMNDAAGVYHYDIDTTGYTGSGLQTVTVEWIGAGAVQAIAVDSFQVEAPPL